MSTQPSRRGRGRPPHPDILTPREWQVLELLRQGLTNEQIAQRLDISYAGAKYHVAEIISKLGVAGREEAAAWRPEAVAVRWWQRALGWVPRRAWPLAGAAGALAAVAALAWIAFGASAGEDGSAQHDSAAAQPTSSPTHAPPATATPQAGPVIVNQPVEYPLQELQPGTQITEEGSYLLEVATGRLWFAPFSLSPDGTEFGVLQEGGALDIIDFETRIGTRLVEKGVTRYSWSPAGDRVVFSFSPSGQAGSPSDPSQAKYVVNIGGTGLRKLPQETDLFGQWSSSGKYIAFTPWPILPEGQRQQLHILDIDTGIITSPLPLEARDDPLYFAWSPIDDRLAYATKNGLFYLDPGTGESTTISGGPIAGGIQWSPDASKILAPAGEFVPFAAGADIRVQMMHIFDVAGRHSPIQLPAGIRHSWSPDGSLIAYEDHGCITGEWDIYTVAPDGSGITRLTARPDIPKEGVHWSPDGSTLAFNTPGEVVLLNNETLEEVVVAASDYSLDASGQTGQLLHMHGDAWSADGRLLLFGAGGGHGICD